MSRHRNVHRMRKLLVSVVPEDTGPLKVNIFCLEIKRANLSICHLL